MAGRNRAALAQAAAELPQPAQLEEVDITQAESLSRLSREVGPLDMVVNAAGMDVRKPLDQHQPDEIERVLDVDLLGPILATRALLPAMREGGRTFIVHIGGFADGRLAFPYYSVDAASRAGLFTFVEGMNRELKLEGHQTRLVYFCPSPADTEAERPFHPLWKQMGMAVVPVEKVAGALLDTLARGQRVGIMGGPVTRLFAGLNAVLPGLADLLVLDSYGRAMREFFSGRPANDPWEKKPSSLVMRTAIGLVVLSFLLYGLIAVVPFTPLSLAEKAAAVPILVGGGELSWWIGLALAGKQVVEKYRSYLNPCAWAACLKKNPQS